jgi:hypothetical protein
MAGSEVVTGESSVEAPELTAAALAARLVPAVGMPPTFADGPQALDDSYGGRAFGFRLDDAAPEPWRVPLVVRLGSGGSVATEAAVLRLIAEANDDRLTVPELRAELPGDPASPPSAASVTTRPTGGAMLELIGVDPGRTGELLGRLGSTQAALHAVKVTDDVDGLRTITAAVDELAGHQQIESGFAKELSWLAAHQPAPAPPVLCHGTYQPGLVTGDPALGEPLVVRNWSGPVLADPEYDVAYTVLAFWAAPFYTGTRSERAGLKMIRDMLTNVYRGGYEGQRVLDGDRLRFWQVFHAMKVSVDPTVPPDLVPALRKHLKRLAS